MFSLRLLTAVSAVLLASCSDDPGPINIREKWGKSIHNFGLQAVYPMREDFYVGDILLSVPAPDCGINKITLEPDAALVGSITPGLIREKFNWFYGHRVVLPKSEPAPASSAATAQSPSVAIVPQATTAYIFARDGEDRSFDRLRLAALPAFSVGTFSKGDLGLTSASAGLGQTFGLSGKSSAAVSVSLTGVEEVQIPAPELLNAVYEFLASEEAERVLDPDNMIEIATHLALRNPPLAKGCTERKPLLVFINRVFYARAIDFDFGYDQTIAATLGVALQAASVVQQRPELPGAGTGSAPPAGPTGADQSAKAGPSVQSLEQSVDAASAVLRALAGVQPSGVGAGFGFGQYGGLVLRQSFERPLAFGVALTYSYDLADVLDLVKRYKAERAKAKGLIGKAAVLKPVSFITLAADVSPDPQAAAEAAASIKQYDTVIEQLKKQPLATSEEGKPARLPPRKGPDSPLINGPVFDVERPAIVPVQPSGEAITVQ
jgi:hypothetical protein